MSTDQRWTSEPSRWAIKTCGLTKRFGRIEAVKGLDLAVPVGGVHGLLGPNGSGKTTTLRMLLGLIRADSGSMEIFGVQVPKHLPEVISRVGAIVESPKFYPSISARRNLEILAVSIGVSRRRVTEVLMEVGLGARSEDKYHSFSLGMKQRLAIAATLLKEPQLLIFDEPTNGLDPAGITDIRTTMRALADAGRTVLVSSHLLSEVEQIADSVSIIGRGQVLAEGELSQFLSGPRHSVVVEVADVPGAHEALRLAGFQSQLVGAQLVVSRLGSQPVVAAEVAKVLGQAGHWPSYLCPQRANLEQVYLSVTAGETLSATQGHAEVAS